MTLLRSRDVDVVRAADRPSARRFLVLLGLGVVLLRSAYVFQPLRSDEGGYLLIARQWHAGGEFIYGDYHVDRPPLLMLVFRAAALTEWDPMIRVFAIPFALLFVVAAWHAGRLLSGPMGARWSALVAAALMCAPSLSADQADGELFAAPLVMTAIALALTAWSSPGTVRRLWLAVAAGLFAGAAPLVKQNFLEGLLFIGVLVIAASWVRRGAGRREVAVAGGAFAGALLPQVLVWLWATTAGLEPVTVWHDLVSFRGRAFGVIWANHPQASVERGITLLVLSLASGVLLVVLAWLVAWRRGRGLRTPEKWALSAILAFGVVAIGAGGSYWPHYLLQLAAGVALAVAVAAPLAGRVGRWMRGAARTVVITSALGSAALTLVYASVPWVWYQQRTGEWLAQSGAPGDTAFVAYGNAAILEAADMGSPYPYLWSLPMRTIDPDQGRLRATIAGPDAPAWIVQVNGLNSWEIDRDSRLRDLVEQRYQAVADVCGHPVWLRRDLRRQLAPLPSC